MPTVLPAARAHELRLLPLAGRRSRRRRAGRTGAARAARRTCARPRRRRCRSAVEDEHAALGGGGDVHVVDADSGAAHHGQPWSRLGGVPRRPSSRCARGARPRRRAPRGPSRAARRRDRRPRAGVAQHVEPGGVRASPRRRPCSWKDPLSRRERVGVRGALAVHQKRSAHGVESRAPLTLALSPRAAWGEGTWRRERQGATPFFMPPRPARPAAPPATPGPRRPCGRCGTSSPSTRRSRRRS